MALYNPVAGVLEKKYSQTTVKAGDTISASVTTIQYYASSYQFPANDWVQGQDFLVTGFGDFIVSAATAPTVVAGLYIGTTGIVVTPAVSNPAGSNGLGFTVNITGTVVSVSGTTCTVRFGGSLNFALTGTTGIAVIVPATTVTFDPTVAQTMRFGATFSSVVSGNSVTFRNIHIHRSQPVAASN